MEIANDCYRDLLVSVVEASIRLRWPMEVQLQAQSNIQYLILGHSDPPFASGLNHKRKDLLRMLFVRTCYERNVSQGTFPAQRKTWFSKKYLAVIKQFSEPQ